MADCEVAIVSELAASGKAAERLKATASARSDPLPARGKRKNSPTVTMGRLRLPGAGFIAVGFGICLVGAGDLADERIEGVFDALA